MTPACCSAENKNCEEDNSYYRFKVIDQNGDLIGLIHFSKSIESIPDRLLMEYDSDNSDCYRTKIDAI